MALVPGTRLGPYEILTPLGAGGMGEVYRARDTRLGRLVAIKVISATARDDADGRGRLLQEARAASALNHPHIVTVHDVGTEKGLEFVAMELVEGQSLADTLTRRRLPLTEVLKYAVQIADAIAAAHAAGIVHRDLKPTNVMITGDGAVKVVDFGIAKSLGPHTGETATVARTTEGRIIGTVGYMSPEQAEGRGVDARSDIFSFGSVLYEMVTGQPPFTRETALATMAAITRDEPRPLSALVATVPPELERIVTRCLRKDVARRFQSMADLRVVLEDLRDDLSAGRLDAVAPTGASRPGVSARRGRALLAATVIGGIIVGVIATSVMRMAEDNDASAALMPTDLARLTYDDGYAEGPALSPDGTLVAYASDRSGADNLDIWVQRAAGGGDPIQLTRGVGDERQPTFSPDGGTILFRSEAEGGALFTMPTLGGQPRLLVEKGIDGRYSPDGQSIAYWTGSQIGGVGLPGSFRTFIIPATGGSPTELQGFTGARYPVWSPDGQFLLVSGTRAGASGTDNFDWWIIRLKDGAAFATGAAAAFRAAGLETAGVVRFLPTPEAWIGGRMIAAGARNLWSVTLGPAPPYAISHVQRLTFGPGDASDPTISREGLVAFVGSDTMLNIWSLPMDAETGSVRGKLTQVTETAGEYTRATFSADGQTLAFQARRGSQWTILIMDTATGRIVDLGVPARPFGPLISPDGTKVAYPAADGGAYVVATRGGAPRKLCDRCVLGDWTSDGRKIITNEEAGGQSFGLVDVSSGDTQTILEGKTLNRPHLSPDNRWLAFRRMLQGKGSQIFIAPVRAGSPPGESEWTSINDPEVDARPCGWAPSGRMLYFLSSRDGFRCLYACPWDPQKGQPRGPVQLVGHFHNFRNSAGGGTSIISTGAGNAVMKDQILFDLASTVSNIWTMRLPMLR